MYLLLLLHFWGLLLWKCFLLYEDGGLLIVFVEMLRHNDLYIMEEIATDMKKMVCQNGRKIISFRKLKLVRESIIFRILY